MEKIKKKDWLKIHKDFRNTDHQNPMMVEYIEGKGTCELNHNCRDHMESDWLEILDRYESEEQ